MKFVIVTGLSGSGKSEAMKSLEDMGYYCVDNLPPSLIVKFAELCTLPNSNIDKVALGLDIRGRKFFEKLYGELNLLDENNHKYEILYLDCSDEALLKRYKMTRRNHPLSNNTQIPEGIKEERQVMEPLRLKSTCIIDTTNMKPIDLKSEIKKIYSEGNHNTKLTISVISFGFMHGIPTDCDLMFDVRFLPNPYYIEDLRQKTGDDEEVRDFVMDSEVSREFYNKLNDMISFLVPQYSIEGKNHLVIGIGCTGGRHRSVTISNMIYDKLEGEGYRVIKKHRDFMLR